MALTELTCKNARCPADRSRLRLADSAGLYLEVTPAGGRYWRWKYRHAGKEKRLALGTYPEVGLAAARRKCEDARRTLADGTDPGLARAEAKELQRLQLGTTFESVARAWFEHWKAPRTARHTEYVMRRLEADVFPAIGARPISEVAAPQLLAMAKGIEARGAVDIAKRALQTCNQILRYAVAHGQLQRNPGADVKPSDALKPRKKENYPRLDAREVPMLLRKIEAYHGTPTTRLAMMLIALTFVRTGELIAARWREFDLAAAEWRIPAERMKMRTPHIVPLSTQALEVLATLHAHRHTASDLLFPGERDQEKPMSKYRKTKKPTKWITPTVSKPSKKRLWMLKKAPIWSWSNPELRI